MPRLIQVDDLHHPALEPYRHLTRPDLIRQAGLFVVEGRLVVQRFLASQPDRVHSLFLTSCGLEQLGPALAAIGPETPVYLAGRTLMREVVGYAFHRGCLALGTRGEEPQMADVLSRARRTVILLEGVTDPDNVGSIFRAARALGGDLILLTKRSADPLYRKTIRTSTGAVFEVPYGFCDDGREQVEQFRRDGWRVAALTPAAEAVAIHDAGIGRDEHLVLLAGTEEGGLSSTLLALADVRLAIPMRRGADSLNVAVATAIALAVLRSVASETDA